MAAGLGWIGRLTRVGTVFASSVALMGCAGGLPELPSMPSLAALSADVPAAPAEATLTPVKADGKVADLSDVNNSGPLGDKALGKTNAPVIVVEYGSLTCPVCAKFHAETLPKIKKLYIDKGKVQFVYREFPIGRSAAAAAMAVRCAPEKDYFKTVDKYYSTQKDWVSQEVRKDEIYKVVQSASLKRDKFDACLTNQATNDALVQVKQRGRAYGVAGTPTFFINGKKLVGPSFEEMAAAIDEAAKTPATPQAQQPAAPPKTRQASVKAT